MDMSIHFPNLGIHLSQVGKSIEIFGFEITYYGMIIAVAMLLGIWFVVLEAKRTNQNQDLYLNLLIIAMIGGIVGARLYYVAFSWEYYQGNPASVLQLRNGGLAIYGGLMGGVLGAALFCWRKKVPFWKMADTVTPSLLLGQVLGRWGNFFNREAFGDYTDNLLAMQLPVSAVRPEEITASMREHLAVIDGVEYIQVHPTFLYECLWNLVLLCLLMWYRRRKKFQGEIFLLYLTGYGLGRVWIEGLRTDQLLLPGTNLPVSQLLSVLLVAACVLSIGIQRHLKKKRTEWSNRRKEEEDRDDTDEIQSVEKDTEEKSETGCPDTEPGGSEKVPEGEREAGSSDRQVPEEEH